jgi:hypothetical protein
MTAVVPTTVMKKILAHDNMYGSVPRKIVEAYIECSPGSNYTLDLATYVPGLSAVASIQSWSGSFANVPTISGTTLTFGTAGLSAVTVLGYY